MKVRYTRQALADLDLALAQIAADSPKGAWRVQKRLRDVIELIVRHPKIGQMTSRRGMRRVVASPYPYLVF